MNIIIEYQASPKSNKHYPNHTNQIISNIALILLESRSDKEIKIIEKMISNLLESIDELKEGIYFSIKNTIYEQ